jgi:hypothetical protein
MHVRRRSGADRDAKMMFCYLQNCSLLSIDQLSIRNLSRILKRSAQRGSRNAGSRSFKRFTRYVLAILPYAVFPEDGKVSAGLPNIEKTLNWVHLSARFPVRVRVEDPDPSLFRIGASSLTVVR